MATTNHGLNARQRRWKSLISNLEGDCIEDCDDSNSKNSSAGFSNSNNEMMGMSGRSVAVRRGSFPRLEVARGFGGHQHQRLDLSSFCIDNILSSSPISPPFPPQLSDMGSIDIVSDEFDRSNTGMVKLQDWIALNRRKISGDNFTSMDVPSQKKYLEKVVRILHSLLFKIVSGCNSVNDEQQASTAGVDDEKILVHPNFISIANVVVCEQMEAAVSDNECTAISADLVGCGDIFTEKGGGETQKKYLAMYALGRIAYAMCMMEDGQCLDTISFQSGIASESSLSNTIKNQDKGNAVIDEEDEIISILQRSSHLHTFEEKDSGDLVSVMLDAGIPFPLCRFVADLLDDKHGSIFRSEHSFSSFKDIMSDLNQMINHPVEFLHGVSPDRWKIVGEKLYKKGTSIATFLDAVDQASDTCDDPMFDGLASLMKKKTSVIMVSGHSGVGKSSLVKLGGARLEDKGWRFIQCEFDRESKFIFEYCRPSSNQIGRNG
jgi:hypothetical protein